MKVDVDFLKKFGIILAVLLLVYIILPTKFTLEYEINPPESKVYINNVEYKGGHNIVKLKSGKYNIKLKYGEDVIDFNINLNRPYYITYSFLSPSIYALKPENLPDNYKITITTMVDEIVYIKNGYDYTIQYVNKIVSDQTFKYFECYYNEKTQEAKFRFSKNEDYKIQKGISNVYSLIPPNVLTPQLIYNLIYNAKEVKEGIYIDYSGVNFLMRRENNKIIIEHPSFVYTLEEGEFNKWKLDWLYFCY